ncbi:MAG TPA: cupredoxin domain-containing protein [Actinomycetota bacterium]|nr:cupredoxin domain-containing protein [Actinomycetota bacterium]
MTRSGARLARRVACAGVVVASLSSCAAAPQPHTLELVVRHSRFAPDRITVERGTEVRFVVHNRDPIDHEVIVGGAAVQARHERGTHAAHDDVPGEVSVGAGATATTTYRFERAGEITIGCHLPGHYAYGMRATVTVVP